MQAIDSSALGGQIPAPSTILLQAIQQFGVIPNFEDLTLPKRKTIHQIAVSDRHARCLSNATS